MRAQRQCGQRSGRNALCPSKHKPPHTNSCHGHVGSLQVLLPTAEESTQRYNVYLPNIQVCVCAGVHALLRMLCPALAW